MKRVTGLGGIFFKCQDPNKMKEWYNNHLGLEAGQYGHNFKWRQPDNPEKDGMTVWSPFEGNTTYFQPSEKPYMVNYRVDDLEKLLEVLKEEGVEVVGEMEVYDYGKFGWIMDPEGNKIELWEPLDESIL